MMINLIQPKQFKTWLKLPINKYFNFLDFKIYKEGNYNKLL